MQNVEVGHEVETRSGAVPDDPVGTDVGDDHLAPFHATNVPVLSTATHIAELAHDTDRKTYTSVRFVLRLLVVVTASVPFELTTTQKLFPAHEIDVADPLSDSDFVV